MPSLNKETFPFLQGDKQPGTVIHSEQALQSQEWKAAPAYLEIVSKANAIGRIYCGDHSR